MKKDLNNTKKWYETYQKMVRSVPKNGKKQNYNTLIINKIVISPSYRRYYRARARGFRLGSILRTPLPSPKGGAGF